MTFPMSSNSQSQRHIFLERRRNGYGPNFFEFYPYISPALNKGVVWVSNGPYFFPDLKVNNKHLEKLAK